ncbi:unnamed protein product [Paramecium pentaurelia]|uniref:Uncharacterized protein n=1 Tax=Paramecium pentaurelia TaxID=43138 RepID=A0A8S1XSP1_9CILI|nr:unnamed protein product [Paramecium pentaurelia]
MTEESNSIFSTIKYYKNKLKFPTFPKQSNEIQESKEQRDLLFCNSKQRKEESYRYLKEWADNRGEICEKNKAQIEQLSNFCEYQIKQSSEYLSIVYKFFNEKYFHEQQYGQFLLTKPQPALKQNQLSQQLYSEISQAISIFEAVNLKRCEKVSNFSHAISTLILKAEILSDLLDLEKRSNQLLSCINVQKKQLQKQHSLSIQKFKAITDLFPQKQSQRQRKPIFDNPIQNEQQNQNIELKQNQEITHQCEEPSTIKINDISEVLADDQIQINHLSEQSKENIFDKSQLSVQQQGSSSDAPQDQEQNNKKVQQKQFEQSQQRSQSQTLPFSKALVDNQVVKQQSTIDTYKLMMSYMATQSYTIKLINQLIEQVKQYWKHVLMMEQKRTKWAQDSCQIYKDGILDVYNVDVELPQFKLELKEYFNLINIYPGSNSFQNEKDLDEFCKSLMIKELGCQAARLLLIKEFKVNVIDKNSELPSILVLTIDKFVGCWLKYDDSIDAIDTPIFHYPIIEISIQKIGELILDIIPSKNILFMNINNGKQKSKIKFACIDDMEEFITIIKN